MNLMIDNLKEDLKAHIIQQLNLEDVAVADIDSDKPLFDSSGLGLDSVDALELIVMLEQHYDILVANPQDARQIFYSISTMADYIEQNQGKPLNQENN